MANPFLVLGGIAISVITAAFGVLAVPGWIASAQDASAVNDVSQVSLAQAAQLSRAGAAGPNIDALSGAGVNVSLGNPGKTITRADATGKHWLVTSRSASGTYFARTDDSARIGSGASIEAALTAAGATITGPSNARVTGGGVRVPEPWAMADVVARNLIMDPSFEGPDLPGVKRVTVASTTAWAADGSKSVAATRDDHSLEDAYVDLGEQVVGGLTNLKPNTRYTFMATYNLVEPFTSVPAGTSGTTLSQRLSIFVHLNNVHRLTEAGVNTAGVRTLRGTFTTPAEYTGYNTIRLYAGDSPSAPTRIMWDRVGLFEGDVAASDWFSGDSTAPAGNRIAWEGEPYRSASVMYR